MNKSENINELAKALVEAQAEMPVAIKTGENPHYHSKYVMLEELIKLTRPILAKHGLAISQFPVSREEQAGVETIIIHSSGQFISNEIYLSPQSRTPQAMASCITYARRYGWQSAIGLAAEEDDDGNGASNPDNNSENNFDKLENFLLVNQIKEEFIMDKLRQAKKIDKEKSLGDLSDSTIRSILAKKDDVLKAWKELNAK